MKKLLLILLCLPMIGFGQTAEEYFKKGLEYGKNGEHNLAIDNYTKCLRIDPDYVIAYYNRGITYGELGNNEDAIADFTRVIRIEPDFSDAYQNRGIAKENAGLPYCSDYKRACNLGRKIKRELQCCEWYYKQCR